MRTVIRVSCIDQQLKAVASPLLASGGMNEAVVAFDFCEKWDGFAKTGVFYRDEEDVYYSLLDENDECIIPHEVYDEPGTFYFTVFGDKDDIRRTASTLRYKAYKGVVGDAMKPSDPTPDVYDQIMAKLNGYDGESGGLSDTAEALLLAILRNAVYTSNQKANIEALEAELNKSDDNTNGDTGEEEPHTHSYTSSVTKAATCTTAGIRTYTCSCGHSYTEPIPATGHSYVDGVCSVCGAADPNHSGSGGDEPHEHVYASEVTKAATCTTAGVHTYTCSCGHTYTEPIPATGHNFVDGVCSLCGEADPDYDVVETNGWTNGTAYEIAWIDGYRFRDQDLGEPQAMGGRSITDFMPCQNASRLHIVCSTYSTIFWYDENKAYLSHTVSGSVTENTPIPTNAIYFRFSVATDAKSNYAVTPYRDMLLTETTPWEEGVFYRLEYTTGQSINGTTGETATDANRTVSSVGYCYGASTIELYPCGGNHRFAFYDIDGEYVGNLAVPDTTTRTVTVPENAKTFRYHDYGANAAYSAWLRLS